MCHDFAREGRRAAGKNGNKDACGRRVSKETTTTLSCFDESRRETTVTTRTAAPVSVATTSGNREKITLDSQ